jgi:hypothetical protein
MLPFMARQCGDIMITGTVCGISFYKTKDGYFARMKTGVPGAVVKKDPRFAGTRQMNSEFGRAGAASRILRRALHPLLGIRTGRALNNRLTKRFLEVIQGDTTHGRGSRHVLDGNMEALLGFEFCQERPLSGTLPTPFKTAFNRLAGRFSVQIPAIQPGLKLEFPPDATHMRFVLAGLNLHATQAAGSFQARVDIQYSAIFGVDDLYARPLTLSCSADSAAPLAVVLGIEFWRNDGVKLVQLTDGKCHAAAVVAVDDGKAVDVQPVSGAVNARECFQEFRDIQRPAASGSHQKRVNRRSWRCLASRSPVRPVIVKSRYQPVHSLVLRL